MRLLINNKLIASMITLNNGKSAFPKENMLSNYLVEKTYFQNYVDIDFGESKTIDSICIEIDDYTNLKLLANSSQSWDYPAYELNITNNIIFINETYRYWRLLKGTYVSPIDYVNGDDQNLDFPNSAYNQNNCFLPMIDTSITPNVPGAYVKIGDYKFWAFSTTGTNQIIYGIGAAGAYGQIIIRTNTATNWDITSLPSAANDGLQKIYFAKSGHNDTLGGYVEYYYRYDCYLYAFNGNQSNLIIAQNKSVYKGSISNSNLVVRWDGKSGPAGSATPDVTEDIPYSTEEEGYINYFYLGEYLQLPGIRAGSTPSRLTTDVTNVSASGQINTTRGIVYKTQSFIFPDTTQQEFDDFVTWWESDDRTNNHFIVQFEEDMDIFLPFFCKITNYEVDTRNILAYNWLINVQEAK